MSLPQAGPTPEQIAALQPQVTEQIGQFTYHDFGTAVGVRPEDGPTLANSPFAQRVIVVAPSLGAKTLGKLRVSLFAEDAPGFRTRVDVSIPDIEDSSGSAATHFIMESRDWSDEGAGPDVLVADLEDRAQRVRNHLFGLAELPRDQLRRAAKYYTLIPGPKAE